MIPAAGTPASVPLRFRIGTRTIASVRRRIDRVALSLGDALSSAISGARSGGGSAMLPLSSDADGRLVTSLPVDRLADLAFDDRIVLVRQRYRRSWIDLTLGWDRWWRGRSAQARSGLGRKARRLDTMAQVRRHATADEIAAFLPIARDVARLTYQERLPDAALPDSPAFVAETLVRAARDEVRGWLMLVGGMPIAYLFCTAEPEDRDTLRYDHLGHDPAHAMLSPGSVLQMAALRDLMAEGRFARFDFLEGDGRHKRLFASDGVDCCDVLILRRTLANRTLALALTGFDAAVARAGASERLRRWTRTIRR